ncbi:hypothetical protein AAF712_008632 [Marasmius tenuissimus]|uniref:Uncharacterized protein n=1 Tax=Marasmius tenuissimus TaxID=585030 RepID=A0ABR2ZSX5_9AGAR
MEYADSGRRDMHYNNNRRAYQNINHGRDQNINHGGYQNINSGQQIGQVVNQNSAGRDLMNNFYATIADRELSVVFFGDGPFSHWLEQHIKTSGIRSPALGHPTKPNSSSNEGNASRGPVKKLSGL